MSRMEKMVYTTLFERRLLNRIKHDSNNLCHFESPSFNNPHHLRNSIKDLNFLLNFLLSNTVQEDFSLDSPQNW